MNRDDLGTLLQLASIFAAVVFVFAVFGATAGAALLIAALFLIGTVLQVPKGDV